MVRVKREDLERKVDDLQVLSDGFLFGFLACFVIVIFLFCSEGFSFVVGIILIYVLIVLILGLIFLFRYFDAVEDLVVFDCRVVPYWDDDADLVENKKSGGKKK